MLNDCKYLSQSAKSNIYLPISMEKYSGLTSSSDYRCFTFSLHSKESIKMAKLNLQLKEKAVCRQGRLEEKTPTVVQHISDCTVGRSGGAAFNLSRGGQRQNSNLSLPAAHHRPPSGSVHHRIRWLLRFHLLPRHHSRHFCRPVVSISEPPRMRGVFITWDVKDEWKHRPITSFIRDRFVCKM